MKKIAVQKKSAGALLPHSFFARDTVSVARDLLGREIVREVGDAGKKVRLRARIVETEAYLGKDDPAAHSHRGPTPRAQVMFGEPGVIYVYFIYGNYFMLNFVTEKKGTAGAVLIRAVEPLEGVPEMARYRWPGGADLSQVTPRKLRELSNGPAKLVLALGINGSLNGKLLGMPHLAVAEGKPVSKKEIVTTVRVGITQAAELPLRFYEKGNPYVSKI